MATRDRNGARRVRVERRVDAATADFVDVGILYMEVFGRSCGEAFFDGADIAPAVYGRIIRGPCRRIAPGGDTESESVPA
jgi:hypothetical protein